MVYLHPKANCTAGRRDGVQSFAKMGGKVKFISIVQEIFELLGSWVVEHRWSNCAKTLTQRYPTLIKIHLKKKSD
jgi:hypothetical protein